MNDMICWLSGILISISIYLMLSGQIMRWLFGVVILSSTTNLVIFVAGRIYSQNPAFIPEGREFSDVLFANPLPQALILTAIVIGFGLIAFSLVLVRKVWITFKTTNSDQLCDSETHYLSHEEDGV